MTAASYEYEYSYAYSDEGVERSDDDSDAPLASRSAKKATSKTPRGQTARASSGKKAAAKPSPTSRNQGDSPTMTPVQAPAKESRNKKDEAIAHLLSRWWYVLPPWPPLNWDYSEQLRLNKVKEVPLEGWNDADDVNEEGFRQCYAVQHMPGCYRLANGNLLDLRPVDGMPCYEGLSQYSFQEICEMLVIALENQLEDFELNAFRHTDGAYIAEKEMEIKQLLRNHKRYLPLSRKAD